jgi:autotransporter-associated beta strand protein
MKIAIDTPLRISNSSAYPFFPATFLQNSLPKKTLMKPKRLSLRQASIACSTLFISFTAPALAVNLYWDTDGATVGSGGATPSGTWQNLANSGTTWSTGVLGDVATPALTTASVDDLFFSAGTDATGSYTVTLGSNQAAKSLTFEEGAASLTGSTLTLTGGGITVLAGSGNPTISSNLTLSGNSIFNVGDGRTLTLNGTTFNRSTNRATLNIQLGTGSTVASSMTGLSALSNRILGPWASFGTGASTTYATVSGGNLVGLTYAASPSSTQGTSVATAAGVTSTAGTLNYDVAAVGTLGAGASVNTLRYTGAAGNIVGDLITKGLMNASSGQLTFSGAVKSAATGNTTEMVINTANGNIQVNTTGVFTGTIVKTGSGIFTLGASGAHSVGGWTVNEGILAMAHSGTDAYNSGTINSGGTLRFVSSGEFNNAAVFTINAGGTVNIQGFNDTIGAISGAGTLTGTSGSFLRFAQSGTFSGNITGAIGIRTSATSSAQVLSGVSDYTGATQILAGYLQLANSAAAGASTIQLGDTSGSDTADLRLSGTGTNVANDLNVVAGSSGAKTLRNGSTNTVTYSGKITANDSLTIIAASNQLTVSNVANSIATGKTVTFQNSGGNGNIIDSALWSGDGGTSFTGSGAGNITLSGAKTYTGGATLGAMTYSGTVAGAGSVIANISSTGPANAPTDGAFGTGTLSIGATRMRAGGADTTIGNAITFIDNPTFTTVASEKSLIFTGNASLGATRTLTVETGSTDSAKFVEFSGEISGSGFGITKAGTGNLVLSGTNTYDGETVIKAGTLKANTSTTIGSSSKITVGDTGSSGTVLDATAAGLTVGATQTLAGIGTVDATGQTVTIVGTGTLAPGNSAGTLSMTVGNLDLGNSTALAFELNPSDTTVGSSINDLVDVTGNLNLDGLLSVVATSGDFLSVVANTSWRLFNYSGTLTDDTLSLGSMPSLGSGLSWSIDTATTGQVNLVVIPEPRAALLGGLGLLALLRRRRR